MEDFSGWKKKLKSFQILPQLTGPIHRLIKHDRALKNNGDNLIELKFLEARKIKQIENSDLNIKSKLQLIADMCRLNTLSMVKKAGSGHLGTSFSSVDIMTFLYFYKMNCRTLQQFDSNRDIFFSSKGHDSPALYSVLYALGYLSLDDLLKFRRLGGLDGHPDVAINGVEANTGSLGMGISKAKGFGWAKKSEGLKGHIYVITGDGELQEGQIFESMQTCVHQQINNITVIVDHNKCQTENEVEKTISLRNLEEKFDSFGWHVSRCDGNNFQELDNCFSAIESVHEKPKIIIADTIKGKGVSFMEHPYVLKKIMVLIFFMQAHHLI